MQFGSVTVSSSTTSILPAECVYERQPLKQKRLAFGSVIVSDKVLAKAKNIAKTERFISKLSEKERTQLRNKMRDDKKKEQENEEIYVTRLKRQKPVEKYHTYLPSKYNDRFKYLMIHNFFETHEKYFGPIYIYTNEFLWEAMKRDGYPWLPNTACGQIITHIALYKTMARFQDKHSRIRMPIHPEVKHLYLDVLRGPNSIAPWTEIPINQMINELRDVVSKVQLEVLARAQKNARFTSNRKYASYVLSSSFHVLSRVLPEEQVFGLSSAMSEIHKKTSDLVDSLKETSDIVKTTVQDVGEEASDVLSQAKSIFAPIAGIAKTFDSIVSGFSDTVVMLWKMILDYPEVSLPTVAIFLLKLMKGLLPKMMYDTLKIALVLALTAGLGLHLSTYISNFITVVDDAKDVGIPHEQSFALMDVIAPLTSIYLMLGVDPNNKGELVKAIKDIPYFTKGASALIEGFLNFAVKLSSLVTIRHGWENDIASIFNAEYKAWSNRANRIMAHAKNNSLDISSLGIGEIEAIIDQGCVFHKSLVERKETLLASMVLKSVASLESIKVSVESIVLQGGNDRQMPVTAVFRGAPGMGKSVAASILAENVLDILLKDYPETYAEFKATPDTFICCKSKDPWFDELTPKKRVIIFDDFASMRTQTQDDAAWPQLIDACNTTRKPVPVADLNKKGLIRFNQLVTLITTNDTNVNDPLLVCVDAVASRINFVFTVSVDPKKVPTGVSLRDTKPDELDVRLWVFTLNIIDPHTGQFHDTGVALDYFDVLTLMVHQARVNENMFNNRKRVGKTLYSESARKVEDNILTDVYKKLKDEDGRAPRPDEYVAIARQITEEYLKASSEEKTKMLEDGIISEAMASKLAHHQAYTSIDVLDFGVSYSDDPSPRRRVQRTTLANALVIGTYPETCTEPERMVLRAGAMAQTSLPSFSVNGLSLELSGEAGFFKQRLVNGYIPIPYVNSRVALRVEKMTGTKVVAFECKPGAFVGRVANYLLKNFGLVKDYPSYQQCVAHWHLSEADLPAALVSALGCTLAYAKIIAQNFSAFKRSLFTGSGEPVTFLNNIVGGVSGTFVTAVAGAFQKCSDLLLEGSRRFVGFVAENYNTIMVALGAIVGIVSLYGIFKGKSEKLYVEEQDSSANRSMYMRRVIQAQRERRALGNGKQATPQDLSPNIEDLADKVVKNLWCAKNPKTDTYMGEVLAIEEDIYFVNAHFFRFLGETIVLYKHKNPTETYECVIADGEEGRPDFLFSFGTAKDLVIVRLVNKQMPRNANITRHFATREYITKAFYMQREEVFLVSQRLNAIRQAYDENTTPNYLRTDRSKVAMLDSKEFATPDGVQNRNDLISYREPTQRGACGSAVFLGSKIVAIHIGGDGYRGYASKVDSSMFSVYKNDEIKEKTRADFEIMDLSEYGLPSDIGHPIEQYNGDVEFFKNAFSRHVVHDIVPYKGRTSFFVPSSAPVEDDLTSHSEFRKKVQAHPQDIDPTVMRFVIMKQTLNDLRIPWGKSKKPYPIPIAIRGKPGSNFGPMPTQTSSGFPYSAMGEGRDTIFTVTPEGDLVLGKNYPEVINHCERFIEAALTGSCLDVVHMDHVKYELRPLDKLKKARVVQTPMFFHFLLGRIFFGPYLEWLADTVLPGPYLVGANPYIHWDHFEQKFLEKDGATRSCDGDYSGFDTCHTIDRLLWEWERIELWFGEDGFFGSPEGKKWGQIRKSLVMTSIVGRHFYGHIAERRDIGMASGISMTTPLNCGVSRGNLEYCYIKAGLAKTNLSIQALGEKFDQDVYAKFLGDDTRFSVSKRTDFFDNLVYRDELKKIGYVYVAADKHSELTPFSNIEDVTLLKRRARWEPYLGKYVGALEFQVIINMMCYHIKNKPDTIFDRANSAIRELCLHPQEVWDLWFPRILAHVGPDYVPPALTRTFMIDEMMSLSASQQSLGSVLVDSAFFVKGMEGFRTTMTVLGDLSLPGWPIGIMSRSDVPFFDLPVSFFDKALTTLIRDVPSAWAPYIDDQGRSTGKFEKDYPFFKAIVLALEEKNDDLKVHTLVNAGSLGGKAELTWGPSPKLRGYPQLADFQEQILKNEEIERRAKSFMEDMTLRLSKDPMFNLGNHTAVSHGQTSTAKMPELQANTASLGQPIRAFREGDEEEPVNPIRKPFALKIEGLEITPVAYEQSGSLLTMENTPNPQTPPTQEGTLVAVAAPNVQHNATTIVRDDTIGVIGDPIDNPMLSIFDTDITNVETSTLSDFVKKPTVYKQGTLQTTDVGTLWTVDVTGTMSAYKLSRLSRVYTLRYDTLVTLQVNADKFQAGRYILFWLPVAGPYVDAWRRMHCAHLTTITQLPHVEIDLATQTSVTLKIPYVNTKPFMELNSTDFTCDSTPGLIGMYTYSPLDPGTGGSTTCGYTVLVSQENLQIGSLAVSQSAGDHEQRAAGLGPISSTLDKVSKVSGLLTGVPGIGLYARNVSWTAGVAARLAHAFGWSKPVDISPPDRMERRISPLNHSADGSTSARVLATVSTNSVGDPRVSRRNQDELAFDYLKRIYTYHQTITWTTSDNAALKIYETVVNPAAYSNTVGKGIVMSPMTFIAKHHTLWRGGLRFRFKLVKTQFHRGRLCVYIDPGTKDSVATLATSEMLYREIVDISETSQFEVCVPYNLARGWVNAATKSATLGIFILDPLVAPTTVTPTVKILVEVAGDETLDFAIPYPTNYNAYAPAVLQSGEYTVTECVELGGSKVNTDVEKFTIGEKLTSFRQEIKQVRQVPNIAPNYVNGGGSSWYPYLIPFTDQITSNTSALLNPVLRSSLIDLLTTCYAVSTGSRRHGFYPFNGDFRPGYRIFWSANPTEWTAVDNIMLFRGMPYAEVNTTIEGNSEVQFPVWNPNFSRSTSAHLINNTTLIPNSNDTNLTKVSMNNWGTTSNTIPFVSAGDDFNLSLFVGIPALTIHSAT